MNEKEFYEQVKNNMQNMFTAKGSDKIVELKEVVKKNDQVFVGLTFNSPETNIAPCFYLNEYYERYINGASFDDLVLDLSYLIENTKTPEISFNLISDYEKVKTGLKSKLVGIAGNESWLSDKVYECFGDFAIVYYIGFVETELGMYASPVTNDLLKSLEVSRETLILDARKNLMAEAYDLRSLREVIAEIFNKEIPIEDSSTQSQMYILTSKTKNNGAVFITRQDVLDDIAQRLGCDYYILPSSVHEVIIVPVSANIALYELAGMVKEINKIEVSFSDKLSDEIQYYDTASGVLENAKQREKRIMQ